MQSGITLNPEQKLYVIPCGDGYSCFGYDNAALHHMQMLAQLLSLDHRPTQDGPSLLERMNAHPLAWQQSDWGQLSGYEKYRQVETLWCKSAAASKTYFDPGTQPRVAEVIELARKSDRELRLFMGDSETGRDWMEEHDVVGRIGRSMGPKKVPLLVQKGERGGPAILTACIVRILDANTLKELYCHPKYTAPNLSVQPEDYSPGGYKFRVDRDGQVQARFKKLGSAHAYVAFMLGHAVTVNTRH